MDYMTMPVDQFVLQFHVVRRGDQIGSYFLSGLSDKDKVIDAMRSRKQEIMDYLSNKEASEIKRAEERKEKIAGIDGLNELRSVIASWNRYKDALDDMVYSGKGVMRVSKPAETVEDVERKYPRAAAYLKAEDMSLAAHDVKAAAGRKALERIINGEDYNASLADAEREWSAYATEHMWD